MAMYESGDSVFTRKAKGYDRIYGSKAYKKRFGKQGVRRIYLPEGLEGCVGRCNPATAYYEVFFPDVGSVWIDAFFLTKGTLVQDVEKGTERTKKVQSEPSEADFVVAEHGQATHFKEGSNVTQPTMLAPIEVPESLTPQSILKRRRNFLSNMYENERTEAETELIREVTKDIRDGRQRRSWCWF